MVKNYKRDIILNSKRINVIGSPGAGKSTIAKAICALNGFRLYDLDDYLYSRNCKRKSNLETKEQIGVIILNNQFIIDGTYTTTFEQRLNYLDLVVLVETPAFVSIYRFFRRLLTNGNLKCGERLTLKTFILLLTFSFKYKKRLEKLTTDRNIYFLKISSLEELK